MKKLLSLLLFLGTCAFLDAQTQEDDLIRETLQLPDSTFQLIGKNNENDTIIFGMLSSIVPEIKDGEFKFFDDNGLLEVKGRYSNNVMSGIWTFYDKDGSILKEIDYDKPVKLLVSDMGEYKDDYFLVEEMPEFENNKYESIYEYFDDNLIYPPYPRKLNLKGHVMVLFTIDERGSVCRISVVKGTENLDLNLEAVRVVAESGPWKCGTQRNKPVPVKQNVTVTFK
jgi:TonB family protein